MRGNMRWKKWMTIAGVLTLMLTCLASCILFTPIYPYSSLWQLWFAPRTAIEVHVPQGYVGPLLIAYAVPDGEIAEMEEGKWRYNLQEDGALLLQNAAPAMGQISFLYENHDGSPQYLTQEGCYSAAAVKTVSICVGGTYEIFSTRHLRPNSSYYVVSLEEGEEWDRDGSRALIHKYLDRLAIPEVEEP